MVKVAKIRGDDTSAVFRENILRRLRFLYADIAQRQREMDKIKAQLKEDDPDCE